MVKCGVEYVFMEVSAHALYYDKIMGLHFKVGIFTNCTQDHLDFFDNMQEYASTKKLMFKEGRCDYCVINCDDDLGVELLKTTKNAYSYGLNNPADTFAIDVDESLDGTSFVMNAFDAIYDVDIKLLALHNVYNAIASATCAMLCGVKIDVVAEGLADLNMVEGRLEKVATFNGGDIFVDFAHTPDGLEKSLTCLKKLCNGKLYCVFGCGGNRDTAKRPIMGEVAGRLADFVILTSDNPRYEDPYDIINQVEVGLKKSSNEFVEITDRRTAIEYAIGLICKGDILIVAGKGGENYQEIMGIKHNFNDVSVIKNCLKRF
jgi:UDP-N-acetylmuramoyl-L-alanyl-D-glutamate--2,6-diaminopimelate ligase